MKCKSYFSSFISVSSVSFGNCLLSNVCLELFHVQLVDLYFVQIINGEIIAHDANYIILYRRKTHTGKFICHALLSILLIKIFTNGKQFMILLQILDIFPPYAATRKKLFWSYLHVLLHLAEQLPTSVAACASQDYFCQGLENVV